jgi:hypothetical protein
MSNQQPEKKTKDLTVDKFPHDLNWTRENRINSLQRLFGFADTYCTEAIKWYNISKRSKQKLGYGLRFLSILAVAVAGIIPVITEIICRTDKEQCISPAWATVFIALAALFVSLDRFAGYTSGWVRYVRSAQKLNELQGQFRLDWCMYLHSEFEDKMDKVADSENKQLSIYSGKDYGLRLCKDYIASVNSVVSRETDAWAQEFKQILIQFEKPGNQDLIPLKLDKGNLSGIENEG